MGAQQLQLPSDDHVQPREVGLPAAVTVPGIGAMANDELLNIRLLNIHDNSKVKVYLERGGLDAYGARWSGRLPGYRYTSAMKYLIVLSFDLDGPEGIADVLKKIDPPSLQGFTGVARVTVDPIATQIEEWLDE
jgi:hypothetical protein